MTARQPVATKHTAGTIWIITELYYPEHTSTGHFLTGIAEGLAESFDVRVICSQPTYAARGIRAPARERRNGVDIRRCRSTTLNKDVLPFRIINAVTLGLATMAGGVAGIRRGDTVMVVTTPPVLPLLLEPICRLRGARLVVLVHDVYPDVLTASGLIAPRSPLVRLLRRLYGRVFRRAERVVVLGRDMRDVLAPRVPHGRITIIPNWGDVDRIAPLSRSRNRLLARLGIARRFVVHYLGNMGRTHDLELLVRAAAAVPDDVHFIFTGSGWGREWVAAEATRGGLGNVHVQPGCSADDLPDYLNACDLAVISLRRGMAGVSVPSRLYNVLAAGAPVLAICEPHSELARVVREHDCGWVVEPGSVAAVLAALAEARRDPARLQAMRERARAAAVSYYSRERVIAQYRSLFESLAGEPAAVPAEAS